MPFPFSLRQMSSTAALVVASSMLVSCGDSDEQKPAAPSQPAVATPVEAAPAEAAPAPAKADTLAETKDALFDALLFKAMTTMGKYAAQPVFTETVRETLDLMQQYYDAMPTAPTEERVKLSLAIADCCRSLNAYSRAGEMYKDSLASFEALAQDVQDSIEMKMRKSSIYNGIASCLLMNAATKGEAAAYYDKQLAVDKDVYTTLTTVEGAPAMNLEISKAACNLISSYRCKGDGLVYTDELEDARDTYKKAVELGKEITSPTAPILLEFVKLLTALGDLENKCGNDLPAAQAWALAARNCSQLYQGTQDNATKQECKRYFDRLTPLIQEKAAILKAANPEGEVPAADAAPAA